ncbi:MAG: type II toxin-antitoxin system HicB family antitoxin [Alphaproteobacteria bacterium]|nr:type II toxin-antitoxin system HicB family antitoxin [Alphaproteobacteria bacterium]
MMEYKGYVGYVTFDDEAELFHGEVINTRDVITFQGKSVEEIKSEFRVSVDEYLEWCKERDKIPGKPFSGKLSLRIPPSLHRSISLSAKQEGKSLNRWIEDHLSGSCASSPEEITYHP